MKSKGSNKTWDLDTDESLRLGHGRDVHTLRIHTGPETWTLQLPAAGWPEGWRAKSEHMRSGVAEWVFQLIDHQANAIDAQPLYSNRSSRHGK